jgi:hypothetical protein
MAGSTEASIALKVHRRIIEYMENITQIPNLKHTAKNEKGVDVLRHGKTDHYLVKEGGSEKKYITKFHSVFLGDNFIELKTIEPTGKKDEPVSSLHILFEISEINKSPFYLLGVNGPLGRINSKSFEFVIPTFTDPKKDNGVLFPWLMGAIGSGGEDEIMLRKLINTVVNEWPVIVTCLRSHPDNEYGLNFVFNGIVLDKKDDTRYPYSVNVYYKSTGMVATAKASFGVDIEKSFVIVAKGNLGDVVGFNNYKDKQCNASKTINFDEVTTEIKFIVKNERLRSCFINEIEQSANRLIVLSH